VARSGFSRKLRSLSGLGALGRRGQLEIAVARLGPVGGHAEGHERAVDRGRAGGGVDGGEEGASSAITWSEGATSISASGSSRISASAASAPPRRCRALGFDDDARIGERPVRPPGRARGSGTRRRDDEGRGEAGTGEAAEGHLEEAVAAQKRRELLRIGLPRGGQSRVPEPPQRMTGWIIGNLALKAIVRCGRVWPSGLR
jgi:hypothetical protein